MHNDAVSRGPSEPARNASSTRTAEHLSRYRPSTDRPGLNPVQLRVAEELLAVAEERPVADLSWAADLAARIEDGLQGHTARIGPAHMWVTKSAIAGALGCEAHYVATKDDFRWSRQSVKGVIVHGAIALAAGGSDAEAHDLADAAFDEAVHAGGRSLGLWVAALSHDERATLVAESVVDIAAFLCSFPPLDRALHAFAEYPLGARVGRGRVRVSGRVDLAVGSPRRGPDGKLRRRRMLIEVKTGMPRLEHRAENLTYALLELLQSRVAPFRTATYYTADATWVADDITQDLLLIAGMRLLDAIKRLIELGDGREPTRQAGWRCAHCPLVQDCPTKAAHDSDSGAARSRSGAWDR